MLVKMKHRHVVGLGFVVAGAALQIGATLNAEYPYLRGAAAGALIIGVFIELIGYAFDTANKES